MTSSLAQAGWSYAITPVSITSATDIAPMGIPMRKNEAEEFAMTQVLKEIRDSLSDRNAQIDARFSKFECGQALLDEKVKNLPVQIAAELAPKLLSEDRVKVLIHEQATADRRWLIRMAFALGALVVAAVKLIPGVV